MSRTDNTELIRAFRLYKIDQMIREKRYPTARDLAIATNSSLRTIARDLDYLSDRYKIFIDCLPNGGYFYHKEDENRFSLEVFFPITQGELFAIGLIEPLLAQYRNTPLEKDLNSLFNKIVQAFPHDVTIDTALPVSNISFISESTSKIDREVFTSIMSAVLEKKEIVFDYQPLQKTTSMNRRLNPYHIVCQRGNWYVLGYCHDKEEVRVFNFSRIKNIKIEDIGFEFPKDFKLENYFDPAVGIWLSSKEKMNIKLQFDASVGTFASEHIWHPKQIITQNKDGSVVVEFETTQIPEVKRWVLGQGRTVKVLEPPELIQQIKEELKDSLAQY